MSHRHRNLSVSTSTSSDGVTSIYVDNGKRKSNTNRLIEPAKVSSPIPSALSPQMELRLRLLPRIGEFKARGWIDDSQEKGYLKILGDAAYDERFEADRASMEVKRSLDDIQRREEAELDGVGLGAQFDEASVASESNNVRSRRYETDHNTGTAHCEPDDKENEPLFYGKANNGGEGDMPPPPPSKFPLMKQRLKTVPESSSGEPLAVVEDEVDGRISLQSRSQHESVEACTSGDIVYPQDAMSTMDRPKMENLFVEMCFFARLGFIQPPSCLYCAQRMGIGKSTGKAKAKGEPESKCTRLVTWRENADVMLHPKKLDGNIVFVTCRAAGLLLQGGVVSSVKWDRSKRRLVAEQSQ